MQAAATNCKINSITASLQNAAHCQLGLVGFIAYVQN